MCTVSFVSAGNKKIITSNRDENIQRETAAAPAVEMINGHKIIFPKDAKAGGTWFAASEQGLITVLLNGAFVKHIPKPPYRKSRGLVLLEIITAPQTLSYFTAANLHEIEPFTVVLYSEGNLLELRWDGERTYQKKLDREGNYIWSSSTLYTDEVIAYRKKLFEQFIEDTKDPDEELIHQFHAGNNRDEENGFVINRKTGMKTFSITQAISSRDEIDFNHTDLLKQQRFKETMHISNRLVNHK